jgi:alginate O-acetyltransferase complex protein AlgI
MLFNSFEFALYLPVVFLIYWFLVNKNLRNQNIFLLIASYFFYGWWDWRFLFLLFSISLFNYIVGIRIGSSGPGKRSKIWLITGLIINLGVLGVFKYFNFFIDSFIDLVSLVGYDLPRSTTSIVLPMGISFYVFLSLSYILDIYRKNLEPDKRIIEVLLSLSFFPIILAGPIQRPASLLPQIHKAREFNYGRASNGLRQILWGLFVKIAVADNLAPYTDDIFQNFSDYSGSTLLLGAIFYSLQIYADFSGYSNIAIGVASLFGFNLMRNFNYPYFSRDITEFWKKWHISLTTWFRDYLFLPVSFAVSWRIKTERVFYIKTDLFIYIVASLVTWFLTGLWHGANYTFIVWGMIHGFFLIIYQWQKKPRKRMLKTTGIKNDNMVLRSTETVVTLLIVLFSWIIFRSETVGQSIEYMGGIFSFSLFSVPQVFPVTEILIALFLVIAEYAQRQKEHALQIEKIQSRPLRWVIYLGVAFIIILFGGNSQQFIYFQF